MIDWVQLLQTFGLAVVILFAVGAAIWRGAKWFGNEIVIPFRDKLLGKFVESLNKLDSTLEGIDRKTDEMLGILRRGLVQVIRDAHDVKRTAVETRDLIQDTGSGSNRSQESNKPESGR